MRTSTQDDSTGSGVSIGVRFPHRSYNDDWTRTLDAFQTLTTLGEGTFGYVKRREEDLRENVPFLIPMKSHETISCLISFYLFFTCLTLPFLHLVLSSARRSWVQKARDRKTGEIVALKKIKMENETEGVRSLQYHIIFILHHTTSEHIQDQ